MSSESSLTRDPLLSGVLLLAETNDLARRLGGLVRDAATMVPGGVAAVYLLDDDGRAVRPVAAHPVDQSGLNPLDAAGDGAADAVALAILDRREVVALAGGTVPSALLSAVPSAGAALHLPLTLHRPDEDPEVEGVLAVACPSAPPEGTILETLRGIAALVAVSALQSRFESALGERSDWLDRLAHTDALTGLANRRTLDRVLELELARAARQGTALCLAIFGVDGQDQVARDHGARVADDVLRRVAASLAETVRLVDTVARYGRAEFVVVAPGSTGIAMAQRAAAAVCEIEPGAEAEPVHVSVGVASFPVHGTTSDELLGAAERALLAARGQGGAIVSAV